MSIWNSNHVDKFEYFSFSLCPSVLSPWSVFGCVATVLLRVALQAFYWDTTSRGGVLLEKRRVEMHWQHFLWDVTQLIVVIKKEKKNTTQHWMKLQMFQKGLTKHLKPGQCWSHGGGGGGVTCWPAVSLELLYPLLKAALSYFPPPTPPNVHLFGAKMNALSLVCVQSVIQKLQEYYFAVLIYKFLIYVNDKGEESFLL